MLCKSIAFFVSIVAVLAQNRDRFPTPNEIEDKSFWMNLGRLELERALERYAKLRDQSVLEALEKTKYPKNVIIFVGDGMSLPTIAATRVLKGQKLFGVSGEEQHLSWERFPESAFLKTYVTNKQTGDSAATAVAMFTGVKTTHKTLGFDAKVVRGKPSSHKSAEKLTSILGWAQDAGMKTGFVTNARVTHATPAALYAHAANRDWECDAFINRKKVHVSEPVPGPEEVSDIARQLMESSPGNETDVILGGGFLALAGGDSTGHNSNWVCSRQDGKDLIKDWKRNQARSGSKYQFVASKESLQSAVERNVDKLLGIFAKSHLSFDYKRPEYQPSLSEMTQGALKLLSSSSKGFFLMVEGARIDHAHHQGYANLALEETLAFDKTIQEAMEFLQDYGILEETLVIVTSDHSHTMSLPGDPVRGANIKGFLGLNEVDRKPELPMVYANGAGAMKNSYKVDADGSKCSRTNHSNDDISSMNYVFPALIPRYEESHGSDDVGLWATGPLAFLFHSTHEQNYVGHVMAFSLCVGPYKDSEYCATRKLSFMSKSVVTPIIISVSVFLVIFVFAFFVWRNKLQRRTFQLV